MTQFQYDVIVKTLQNGVPAMSNELIESLTNLVKDYQELVKKNTEEEKTDAV